MIFQPLSSGSSGNLYLVRGTDPVADRMLAIECGIPYGQMQRKLQYRLADLDGVLISHSHGDHARALKYVLASGVDVYGPEETFKDVSLLGQHRAHAVEPLVPFVVKDHWHVLPFDLRHDVPAVGYLIQSGDEKLIYITDTGFVPYRFSGLTIIAIEANFSEDLLSESSENINHKMRSLQYHLSIERVIGFLLENDMSSVREIHLLHLSDAHSDEKMFRSAIEAVTGKPVYVARREER